MLAPLLTIITSKYNSYCLTNVQCIHRRSRLFKRPRVLLANKDSCIKFLDRSDTSRMYLTVVCFKYKWARLELHPVVHIDGL